MPSLRALAHAALLATAAGVAVGPTAPAVAGSGCPGAHERPAPERLHAAVEATICVVNAERARHGRAPVRESAKLARVAARYSRLMVSRRFFAHVTPWGEELRDRLLHARYARRGASWHAGENLGWGTGGLSTPAAMVTGWMRSPGHRANVLDGRWRRLGVGVAEGSPRGDHEGRAATYTLVLGSAGRAQKRSRLRLKRVMVGRKARVRTSAGRKARIGRMP